MELADGMCYRYFLSNPLTPLLFDHRRMSTIVKNMARMCRTLALHSLLALTCCFLASSARASILFINKTPTAIEVAVGYQANQTWVSEGWWRIEPGLSVNIRLKRDKRAPLYYFATTRPADGGQAQIWGGNVQFCVSDEKAFRIRGKETCDNPHEGARGFARAPIKAGTHTYRLEFKNELAATK